MKNTILKLTAIVLMSVPLASFAVPILNVQGGQLMGATGVNVGGTLYDVAFVDGTCIELFDGCDSVSDFVFQTQGDAYDASQALLDQIFLDVGTDMYDTEYNITNGCEINSAERCIVQTAFGFFGPPVDGIISLNNAENYATEGQDINWPNDATNAVSDTTAELDRVWAVWSDQPSAIPEPGTLALLGLGLVGMAARRRRKTASI